MLRATAAVLAVGALAFALLRTLLDHDAVQGADFWNHYWYVWHQAEALKASGPTLFVHDNSAVFAPRYAFYGGTLYLVTAALGLAIGSVFTAYVATYFLAFGASYGGWWWLGRQAGLSRGAAHAPGLVFATAAYSVTLPVFRGAWGEYVAVSALPPLVASALSVLRADRLRAGPAVVLAVSVIAFTGSHSLTILTGGTFLLIVTALSVAAIPQARRMLTRRGVRRVAAVAGPAVLVNAWFLLPAAAFQSHTLIAHQVDLWAQWLDQFDYLLSDARILTLTRDPSDQIVVTWGAFALPVLAMTWCAAGLLAARPRLGAPWVRAWFVVAIGAVLVIAVMTHPGLLRGPFLMLQFAHRLESIADLAIAGVVLVTLVLLRHRPPMMRRIAAGALGVIVAVSVVQAVLQAGYRRDLTGNLDIIASPSYYTPKGRTHIEDYFSGEVPIVSAGALPLVVFPPTALRHGAITVTPNLAGGQLVAANFGTMPQLVHLEGAHLVALDQRGYGILRIDDDVSPGGVRLTIRGANPPPVVIGRWLSVLGLLGLAANGVVLLRRSRETGRAEGREREALDRPTAAVG